MLSDRPLIYGVNYGYPQPAGVTRAIQRQKLREIGSAAVRQIIGLRDVWKAPYEYDWDAETDAMNETYAQAVVNTANAGITVIGNIQTTPDFALTLGPTGTATGGGNDGGLGYLDDTSQDFTTLAYSDQHEVRIIAGPGAVVAKPVESVTPTRVRVHGNWGAGAGSVYELRKLNHRWPPEEWYAQDFTDMCAALAARFQSLITYWEFWNEENTGGSGWYRRDWEEYAKWLARASDGLKAGNPNAVVCVGGFEGARDDQYLNGLRSWLAARGWQNKYGALALHPYPADEIAELPWSDVAATRTNMEQNGDGGKPIWFTEYGWWEPKVTEAQQNDRLRSALLELESDSHDYVTIATWLSLIDLPNSRQVGFLRGDMTPRTSYGTFGSMSPKWTARPQVVGT